MTNDNVAVVRNAYQIAERKDLQAWISAFTADAVFNDNSTGMSYRGRELADVVVNYGTAFSNMHRELYRFYVDGNVVVEQLALQGTHDGPLQVHFGELAATGRQMDAVLRRVRTRRRQDQALRLLPGRVNHLRSPGSLDQPRSRTEHLTM